MFFFFSLYNIIKQQPLFFSFFPLIFSFILQILSSAFSLLLGGEEKKNTPNQNKPTKQKNLVGKTLLRFYHESVFSVHTSHLPFP